MADIRLTPTQIDITFTTAEKVGGLLRDQTIPRSAVASVEVVEDGYLGTTGVRAPGLGIPGRRRIGTWRTRGATHLVSVRRGEPALRIGLVGQRYDSVLIGTPQAEAIARALG
jgi:hypothetical protein